MKLLTRREQDAFQTRDDNATSNFFWDSIQQENQGDNCQTDHQSMYLSDLFLSSLWLFFFIDLEILKNYTDLRHTVIHTQRNTVIHNLRNGHLQSKAYSHSQSKTYIHS